MISNSSYAIGLTGGICTGKSASEQYLKKFFPVIDADQLVHDLYKYDETLKDGIIQIFGQKVVEKGFINRKLLGQIVFSNKDQLNQLVSLVRPIVTKQILQMIQECRENKQLTIFSIPLLFENSWKKSLDETIVIVCDEATQLLRVQIRDNKSKEDALKVIQMQMPQNQKMALADFVVQNDGTLSQLQDNLKTLFPQIT